MKLIGPISFLEMIFPAVCDSSLYIWKYLKHGGPTDGSRRFAICRLQVLVIKKLSTSNPFLWESQSVITIWVEGAVPHFQGLKDILWTAFKIQMTFQAFQILQGIDGKRPWMNPIVGSGLRGLFQRAKAHRCLHQRAASCRCLVGRLRHWERRWQQQIFWFWELLGEAVCWRQGWSRNSLLVSGRDIQIEATEPDMFFAFQAMK